MKALKLEKKISLKKEKIVNLNKQQMNNIKGGGIVTWANCPLGPSVPSRPSDACATR